MSYIQPISATKITSFLNNLNIYDIHIDDVLKTAHVKPDILSDPDNRLSGTEVQQIIQSATTLSQDNYFGLHQGERISKGFSNILGYILMNCSTLKEGLEKYCRYERIVDGASISDFHIADNVISLSNITIDPILKNNIHFTEFKIAGINSYIKLLTNHSLKLHEVHFTHSTPDELFEYERIFQCQIYFNKSENALIFDKEQLKIELIEPNKNLLHMFEDHAQELLKAYTDNSYSGIITEIIINCMKHGNLPTINEAAKHLFISPRSLQLYLHSEGTSYTRLIYDIRKNYATAYLKNKNMTISDITYTLGFSEISAFHRAFKNWTGLTPKQYRERMLSIKG